MIAIPEHLGHLRTDRHGRPAPFLNVIGLDADPGGDVDRWSVKFDRLIGARAAYYDDEPNGEPNLARQSIQRQRQVVILSLCQVCGRHVSEGEKMLVISPSTVRPIEVAELGGVCAAIHEPWLCPDCGPFAVTVCPELIRRKRDEQLTLINIPADMPYQVTQSTGWLSGRWEAATKRDPVVMWLNIALPRSRVDVPRPPKPSAHAVVRERGMSVEERERLNKVINDVPALQASQMVLDLTGKMPEGAREMLEKHQRERDPAERETLLAERRKAYAHRLAAQRARRRR